MATQITIGGSGTLFVGEDKVLRLHVLDTAGVPIDITGWTIQFVLCPLGSDTATLTVAASIVGVYTAVYLTNTQRASVSLTDTQTVALTAGRYRHSWKRMDADNETVLAYGECLFETTSQM